MKRPEPGAATEALLDRIGDCESRVRELEEAPRIPPEVVEEWQTLIADFVWWFHGYEAAASKRQRSHLPDLGRLRRMREDIFRVATGKDALATLEREIPF